MKGTVLRDTCIEHLDFKATVFVYNDPSYFAMLFAAGVGIGMFYYGVSETILHYVPDGDRNLYWFR